MNINTENYEEFFLLYADNELSAEQRLIVEMFVKTNPQLQKEWDDIMATVQMPEPVTLIDKSSLLKSPLDAFIDKNNYDQRFVEYHDNELDEKGKAFVAAFLSFNPDKKKEFDLIGHAKVAADEKIIFSEKESLYRHAAKIRYGFFMRIAAVAAILLFLVWFGINSNRSLPADQPRSVAATENNAGAQPKIDVTPKNSENTTPPIPDQKVAETPVRHEIPKPDSKNVIAQHATVKSNKVSDTNHQLAPPETINNDKNTALKVKETPPLETEITMNTYPEIRNTSEIKEKISHVDMDITPVKEHPEIYYASLGQQPEENNFVFMDVPVENVQRSKLGIFIKKVKRTIDRNNPINRLFNGEEQ